MTERTLQPMVLDKFRKYLLREEKSTITIKKYIRDVKRFILFAENQRISKEFCRVKVFKCQRQTYCTEEKELTKAEYMRLLDASKTMPQLNLILQTICSTGIRISELKYFTVEAVKRGAITLQSSARARLERS